MAENNIGALFARIAKISGLVGGVSKSGKSGDGGGVNYKYHSADDIMGHLNKLMAEHGIAIIPNVVDTTIMKGADEIERWLITYEYTIGDIDGNTMTARWTGEAPLYGRRKDNSLFTDDKSLGKAHTYAYKYYLMKLFMVSTVDTDDLDTNQSDSGKQAPAKLNKPSYPPKNNPAPATTHKHDVDSISNDAGLLYTPVVTQVTVKEYTGKNGKRPLIEAQGVALWSRDAFRAWAYDGDLIDQLAIAGEYTLDESEHFTVAYKMDGQKKVAVKLIRESTGDIFEIK